MCLKSRDGFNHRSVQVMVRWANVILIQAVAITTRECFIDKVVKEQECREQIHCDIVHLSHNRSAIHRRPLMTEVHGGGKWFQGGKLAPVKIHTIAPEKVCWIFTKQWKKKKTKIWKACSDSIYQVRVSFTSWTLKMVLILGSWLQSFMIHI